MKKRVVAALTLLAGMTVCSLVSFDKNVSASTQISEPPLVLGLDGGSPSLTENFNPYSPNLLYGTNYIYEPLYVVNPLNGTKTPWLATGFQWKNNKTVQFTIRSRVKWSDGTPFTAKDVVFTFNMLHKFPALDLNSVWSVLKSVTASGNTVTFNFSSPDVPYWQYIAQTAIVQEKQWSQVKNPVTYVDDNPIGTGPFTLGSFNSNQYTLKQNPYYWQKTKVQVPSIVSMAMTTNTTDDLMLSQGKFDMASLFVPNIERTYVARDPQQYHYWFAPSTPVYLEMNDAKYPFNNVDFRRAMAYAIDRQKINQQGEDGYEPPANQSFLPPALQPKWLNKTVAAKYNYSFNTGKAASLLAKMGLKKNSQGQLIGKGGKPIVVGLEVPTGWTDWVQDCQIIKNNLESLGITVNFQTPSSGTFSNNMTMGSYDMGLNGNSMGINEDPWIMYYPVLSSKTSAPVGKPAASNYERWMDPATDRLLDEYASTTDNGKQHEIINQLQQIMYSQVPVVDLVQDAIMTEYQTSHYVGWPSASNPYAVAGGQYPDNLLIITHLKAAK